MGKGLTKCLNLPYNRDLCQLIWKRHLNCKDRHVVLVTLFDREKDWEQLTKCAGLHCWDMTAAVFYILKTEPKIDKRHIFTTKQLFEIRLKHLYTTSFHFHIVIQSIIKALKRVNKIDYFENDVMRHRTLDKRPYTVSWRAYWEMDFPKRDKQRKLSRVCNVLA